MSNEEFEIEGKVELLSGLNASDLEEHFKSIGANEDIIAEAMKAAQEVLVKNNIELNVIEISVEKPSQEIINTCRCGSRCVARKSVPYTRCYTRNGQRICVQGHRLVCTRRACNPC